MAMTLGICPCSLLTIMPYILFTMIEAIMFMSVFICSSVVVDREVIEVHRVHKQRCGKSSTWDNLIVE